MFLLKFTVKRGGMRTRRVKQFYDNTVCETSCQPDGRYVASSPPEHAPTDTASVWFLYLSDVIVTWCAHQQRWRHLSDMSALLSNNRLIRQFIRHCNTLQSLQRLHGARFIYLWIYSWIKCKRKYKTRNKIHKSKYANCKTSRQYTNKCLHYQTTVSVLWIILICR